MEIISLHKRYAEKGFQSICEFLKLIPIFRAKRRYVAIVVQHTHQKINVRLVSMMSADYIDMSARKDVAQILKTKCLD